MVIELGTAGQPALQMVRAEVSTVSWDGSELSSQFPGQGVVVF
jgi:hypothetical protein